MHSSVFVIVDVNLSVCHTRGLYCAHVVRPTITISSTYGSPVIVVFWRHISSPHSNGMTFKFKVEYKWGRQNVVFSIKTACISKTVSRTIRRKLLYFTNSSMTLNELWRSFQPMLSFPRPISRKLYTIRPQKLVIRQLSGETIDNLDYISRSLDCFTSNFS